MKWDHTCGQFEKLENVEKESNKLGSKQCTVQRITFSRVSAELAHIRASVGLFFGP